MKRRPTVSELMAVKESMAKADEKNIIINNGERYYDIRSLMIEKGHIQ